MVVRVCVCVCVCVCVSTKRASQVCLPGSVWGCSRDSSATLLVPSVDSGFPPEGISIPICIMYSFCSLDNNKKHHLLQKITNLDILSLKNCFAVSKKQRFDASCF